MTEKRIYNYFDRNPELKVLFVFDKMAIIESELKDVAWPEDYVYKVFDGKWFNLKLSINRDWNDKKVVLLFPWDLRPETEEKRAAFQLLDVYAANMEYMEESYAEFLQRYGLPQTVAPFVQSNISELSSQKILGMLSGYLNAANFNRDLGCRAFVSSYLGDKKLLDWETIIVKLILLGAQSEEKKRRDFFIRLEKNRDAKNAVVNELTNIFGISYNPNDLLKMKEVAERLKYNAIMQSLAVVQADNYKNMKVASRYMLDRISAIYELGTSDPLYSEKFKTAMRELAGDVKESELLAAYGPEADFYFMTESLSMPLISSSLKDKVESEPLKVIDKMRSLSLRLGQASPLMPFVRFVETVAHFYNSLAQIESLKLDNLDKYVELYVESFHKVDMFYRKALALYYELSYAETVVPPEFAESKQHLDGKYASAANRLTVEWLSCVRDSGDSLKPVTIERQNDFFANNYVANKKLVIIVSDALRYEVGVELMEELGKKKHIATITPMLAQLPAETKFTKPALLPHEKLTLQGDEMAVDGKILSTTQQKETQILRYKPGAVCVNFSDVCHNVTSQRELFKNQLVYVMHDRIDHHGHDQSAEEITKACRETVAELVKFIHSLHMSLNVYNVIVTSDHGFLFNDIKFEEKDKIQIKEETLDKTSRYYLTLSDAPVEEVVKLPLSEVSAMESSEKVYVATPNGNNRFAAPGGYMFAHGGASLQELLVPVIHSNARKDNSKQLVGVVLKDRNLAMVSSLVRFQLVQKEAVSMDMMPRTVVCGVYDGDTLVTDEATVTLDSTDAINISNRTYNVALRLNQSNAGSLLQLRVFNAKDAQNSNVDTINPLIKEIVKNNTIIDQDF